MQRIKSTIFIFACLVITAYQAFCHADKPCAGGSIDYATYGNAPFPYWCNLTDFEISALQGADSARAGIPNALLALALFASGNLRDQKTVDEYAAKITSFIEKEHATIAAIKNSREKGRTLYASLCRTFFDKSFMNNKLNAYRPEQSQLSELLRTKRYNCISSALLCLIIFRYFNLEISGVILPTHVFLLYTTPEGERIEIETTHREGYDFKHDDKYFRESSSRWAKARKLRPITREEYARRRIVSAFITVCSNLANQHVSQLRMPWCDSDRLFEASGYLEPDDATAVSNRLAVYNNQFRRLDSLGDFATALRMYDKIGPILKPMFARWSAHQGMTDNLSLVWFNWILALEKNDRFNEALDKSDTLLGRIDARFKYADGLKHNIACVVGESGIHLMQQNKFLDAKILLDRFNGKLANVQQMGENYRYLYNYWAGYFFDQKKFREAIRYFETALSYTDNSGDKNITYSNIASAYINLSGIALSAGNKREAVRVLNECVEKHPECTGCRKRLDSINKDTSAHSDVVR